ncbi:MULTISPECIES: NAD(P)H oxidoreductase [unclassified Paenibacillus]|uniref:NAD(P)H oxidoreductase n=1 Tax=unclassified Paenibacillus TaxID=185978 RepID=UPI000FE23458|nr:MULTISPECIES: NAD(P)H oxidoreductase [unclassified Paenibacillus]MCM3172490.1 NAD(P)H oxidoreductase [Paenibacillus sp. MER 99-2]
MKIKLVVTHPRQDSLTFAVMNQFIVGIKENHHEVDILDLYHDGFDPLYTAEDEKDWQNPNKHYAPAIRKEMDRILDADAIVLIFPIWWYSVPSMLKAYLDKIWNMGLLHKVNSKKTLWIGLAGGTEAVFEKYGYSEMITNYLNNGIAGYAGIQHSDVVFLYETLSESRQHIDGLLEQAYQLGRSFS